MSDLEAIVLGLVQGLTEFLPISSSGHLRIVPALLGWSDPGAGFTAVIQLGTMAAVADLLPRRPLAHSRCLAARAAECRFATPARRQGWAGSSSSARSRSAIFGFVFKDQIESGARSLYLIGSALILFSFVMVLAERVGSATAGAGRDERPRRAVHRHGPGAGADPRRLALGGDDLRRPASRLRPGRRRPLLVPALGAGRGPERPLRAAQGRRRRQSLGGGDGRSPRSSPSSPATWRSPGCSATSAPTHWRSSSSTGSRLGVLVIGAGGDRRDQLDGLDPRPRNGERPGAVGRSR